MFGLNRLAVYGIGALIALSLLTGLWIGVRNHYYNQGWDAALNEVEKHNAEAKQAARAAQGKVDKCYDAGGNWSVITGACQLQPDKPPGKH